MQCFPDLSLIPDLKVTVTHSDWYYMAPPRAYSEAPDELEQCRWGQQFPIFKLLEKFELEVEIVEEDREVLDDIVDQAAGWHFPFKSGKMLIMNPAKTKRTGRHAGGKSEPSIFAPPHQDS